MPPLRPRIPLLSSQAPLISSSARHPHVSPSSRVPPPPPHRPLTTTSTPHSSASHPPYDVPQGWLFGVPPGQKYEKEGWEGLWVWGFWGSLAFGVVGLAYKPDSSIQTWALEEARRRLEIEGILEDPFPDPIPASSPTTTNTATATAPSSPPSSTTTSSPSPSPSSSSSSSSNFTSTASTTTPANSSPAVGASARVKT